VDEARPARPVEVQLYVDGRFVGATTANLPRPDVLRAGRAADELHGFSFQPPTLPPGEHEARVYALHTGSDETRRTLHQIGFARKFVVEAPAAQTAPVDRSGGLKP
jgi:hypothetical protein